MNDRDRGAQQHEIGLLHPGEMGAAIGAALRTAGHHVRWASEGRGTATVQRAEAAGLEDVVDSRELGRLSEVIVSVIPPSEAIAVASLFEDFSGLYIDANAIAPDTTRQVGDVVHKAGGRFVDGGIIGAPPAKDGDCYLYLSGPDAAEAAALFAGTVVNAIVVGPTIGDASAVKMAYAGWTKGTAALLLTVREYARREGVEETLLNQWALSYPQLEAQWAKACRSAETKGWRWIGEMEEIAAALRDAGLPAGFHEAAAAVYGGASEFVPGSFK